MTLPAAQARAVPVAAAPDASSALAACVQATHKLDVVLLVDESGSLGGQGREGSDPTGRRVDGVKAALSGLAALNTPGSASAGTSVKALFAGFSSSVETVPAATKNRPVPFQQVIPSTLPKLFNQSNHFAESDRGADTDFTKALSAGRSYLASDVAEQTANGGTPPCRAIVLFTDGQLDLGSAAATASAHDALCNAGGVGDQLRRDGITLFSVALNAAGANDQTLLRAVTDGSAGSCSTTASPGTGKYLTVDDAGELSLLFGTLFSPGGSSGILHANPGTFLIPTWANRFVVHLAAASATTSVQLTTPAGSGVPIALGSSRVPSPPGTAVTVTSLSSLAADIAVVLSPGQQRGIWTLSFPKSAPVAYEVQLFADIEADLTGAPTITPGLAGSLPVEVHPLPGSTAGTDVPVTSTLQASLAVGGTIQRLVVPRDPASSTFKLATTVPATDQSAEYELTTQVLLPPAGGLPVNTVPHIVKIARGLPDVPSVSPPAISLTSITGKGSGRARLMVRGAAGSAGCVWFDNVAVSAPAHAGKVTGRVLPAATSPATCIHVGAGESRAVDLRVDPAMQADGVISGTLLVHSTSVSHPEDVLVSHKISGWMRIPPNPVRRWAIFGLLLFGLVALPLLVVHLVNYSSATFTPPVFLRAEAYPIEVRPYGLYDASTGLPFEPVQKPELKQVDPNDTSRFRGPRTIGGISFRTTASGFRYRQFRPFRGPYGVASVPDGSPLLGYNGRIALPAVRTDRQRRIPLPLSGLWFYRPTSASTGPAPALVDGEVRDVPARTGVLTVIVRDGAGADAEVQLARTAASILETTSLPDKQAAAPSRSQLKAKLHDRSAPSTPAAPAAPPPVDDPL